MFKNYFFANQIYNGQISILKFVLINQENCTIFPYVYSILILILNSFLFSAFLPKYFFEANKFNKIRAAETWKMLPGIYLL